MFAKRPGSEVITLFSCSTEHKILTAHKTKILTNKEVPCFKSVGILTFLSRINFVLS